MELAALQKASQEAAAAEAGPTPEVEEAADAGEEAPGSPGEDDFEDATSQEGDAQAEAPAATPAPTTPERSTSDEDNYEVIPCVNSCWSVRVHAGIQLLRIDLYKYTHTYTQRWTERRCLGVVVRDVDRFRRRTWRAARRACRTWWLPSRWQLRSSAR